MRGQNIIKGAVLVSLIIFNIILQVMCDYSQKPRCIVDECNHVRAKTEFYCKNHKHFEDFEIDIQIIRVDADKSK